MDAPTPGFEFELPILDRQAQLRQLEQSGEKTPELEDQIRRLRREIADVTRDIYSNLSPWQTVQVARHKDRPHTCDNLKLTCEDFVELHGDRQYRDDPSIVAGLATLSGRSVAVIGQQKGRTTREKVHRNFGMAHPEGYRKACRIMRLAERFRVPLITFLDTPGA